MKFKNLKGLSMNRSKIQFTDEITQKGFLMNWVLENMKKPELRICEVMESKMNEIIDKLNQTHDIFEADKLHRELGILESIFYQVCSNEIKQIERL